jgi:glycosyltransferase involved in cell wall biosynthesis
LRDLVPKGNFASTAAEHIISAVVRHAVCSHDCTAGGCQPSRVREHAMSLHQASDQPVAFSDIGDVMEATVGRDVRLLVPLDDRSDPEVTVLVPAVNEEITISEFVAWCKEGLASAGAVGEILIVDSSTDSTPDLALAAGARVLKTPRRGLGRAYIDAVPFVRGRYVVMGDADCTYDFRHLGAFIDELRSGTEFAMGSRWLGTIEPGSMPWLHRRVGTPVTTWILNRLYGSHFSDIHCGMRGVTRDGLMRMGLASQSWEYASEMVLKSVRMGLRTNEVPVTFLKDRDGRVSHHRRSGWFSPFQAAWINLRAMFVYGADYFLFRPGLVLLSLGLLLTVPLSFGSLRVGPVTFSLYWMLLGMALSLIGLQSLFFGILAQVLSDYRGTARRRWMETYRYTRTMALAFVSLVVGAAACTPLIARYVASGLVLPPAHNWSAHLAVTGLLLIIAAFSIFGFALVLHATTVRYGRVDVGDE